MLSTPVSRPPSLNSLEDLNAGLFRTGVKYRIRATNQSPRISIRAVHRFEDGSKVRAVDLYHEKPGDLEKARDLCLLLQNEEYPLSTLLKHAPNAHQIQSGWGGLIKTFERYLNEQGIKWKDQCQATHIRHFERFAGPVCAQRLMQWVEEAEPNSSDRVRRIGTLNKLIICAELDVPEVWLKRINATTSFSAVTKAVNPRDLPTDEQIEAFVDAVPCEKWKVAFGFIATYGLRPHEIFCINGVPDADGLLEVNSMKKKKGQEGWRFVIARRTDWIERWNLAEGIQLAFDATHSAKQLGKRVSTQFGRYRNKGAAPVWREKASTYDLRHAFAGAVHTESKFEKIGTDQAARWMGHSRKVHEDTYLRWLSKASAKEAARRVALGLA